MITSCESNDHLILHPYKARSKTRIETTCVTRLSAETKHLANILFNLSAKAASVLLLPKTTAAVLPPSPLPCSADLGIVPTLAPANCVFPAFLPLSNRRTTASCICMPKCRPNAPADVLGRQARTKQKHAAARHQPTASFASTTVLQFTCGGWLNMIIAHREYGSVGRCQSDVKNSAGSRDGCGGRKMPRGHGCDASLRTSSKFCDKSSATSGVQRSSTQ